MLSFQGHIDSSGRGSLAKLLVSIAYFIYLFQITELRFFPPLYPHTYIVGVADPLYRPQFYLFFLSSSIFSFTFVLMLVGGNRRLSAIVRGNAILFCLVAYVAIQGAFFLQNGSDVIYESMNYLGLFCSSVVVLTICGHSGLVKILMAFCVSFALLNAASLLFPDTSFMLHDHFGRFRGFLPHKNRFGTATIHILLASMFMFGMLRWRARFLLVSVLFLFLLASRQSTALILLAILVVALIFRAASRRFGVSIVFLYAFLLFSAAILIVVSGTFTWDDLLRLLERDASLTGRDQVWAYFANLAATRPILGFGVTGAFTLSPPDIVAALGWQATSAHSSYIEIVISFGVVGLLLFFTFLVQFVFRSIAVSKYDEVLSFYMNLTITFCMIGGIQGSLELAFPRLPLLMLMLLSILAQERLTRSSSDVRVGAPTAEVRPIAAPAQQLTA